MSFYRAALRLVSIADYNGVRRTNENPPGLSASITPKIYDLMHIHTCNTLQQYQLPTFIVDQLYAKRYQLMRSYSLSLSKVLTMAAFYRRLPHNTHNNH